jgi:hypothetical protein
LITAVSLYIIVDLPSLKSSQFPNPVSSDPTFSNLFAISNSLTLRKANMKKNKKLAVVAGVIAASLTLAGAPSAFAASSNSATINIGSLYEPQNLSNLAGGGQGINEVFNGNVYEGLFKLNDNGKVDKLLASSYSLSKDRLTYTIKLT